MNSSIPQNTAGLLAWFASNPIAANLLMLLIFIGGGLGFYTMDKEVFPHFNLHKLDISVTYPGASPLEVEESVCARLETAVYDLAGIKQLNTVIRENMCIITVTLLPEYDQEQITSSLYGRIQSITNLPKNLEAISIKETQRAGDDGVIWVALHGKTSKLTLQRYGEQLRTEFERIDGVRLVKNYNEIPYEIVIEVSPIKLQHYQLSLHDISKAIRQSSINQSSGLVKTSAGDLQINIQAKAKDINALNHILLRTQKDGSRLYLGDIANIKDDLQEKISEWHSNGETAQGFEIHTKHSAVEVARSVKEQVARLKTHIPNGLSMTTWWDDSLSYDERINTLVEDGLSGFALVCLVLTLFLRLRVALWAGVGIFTSVLGAFMFMPMMGVSLNMMSLFGFLLAMGILVDDAIIIGESVFAHQQQAALKDSLSATIEGLKAVALPVILSVLVSLVAFLPGLFLPGWSGQMMQPICLVMMLTLLFSLIEALLILPSHLVVHSESPTKASRLTNVRDKLNNGLERFVQRYYAPFLRTVLAWRFLTLVGFVLLIMLCALWVETGRIRLSLQADVTKDNFWVSLTTPKDLPFSETVQRAKQVEQAFFALRDELDSKKPDAPSVVVNLETIIEEHWAGFWTEFSPRGREEIKVEDFIDAWRKKIGDLGRSQIDFFYKEGDLPYDVTFDLSAENFAVLPKAAEQLKAILKTYKGVYDVIDSMEATRPEISLQLKPLAEHLGLRLEDLSTQVRNAYYGDEVERLQRGRNEVKVMVRYPRIERASFDKLQLMPVQLPDGNYVPLSAVAGISLTPSVSTINRQDRRRLLKVLARVDKQQTDLNALISKLEANELTTLSQTYPGLSINPGEEYQEQQATLSALKHYTLLALLVIYVLIAIPFRSYLKPLIFLLAAPVAWCGAIIAHAIAGLPLSMESLVGMIAASGVVVNDSLVLLDYLKEHEHDNKPLNELIADACTSRFRPIFLAFLTNFAGFLPTLIETSPQAQFLIPMTLSLSAGLLLGMAASLVLTPVCYGMLTREEY